MGLLEQRKWMARSGSVKTRTGLTELQMVRIELVHSRTGLFALDIGRHSVHNYAGTAQVQVWVEPEHLCNYWHGFEPGEAHSCCRRAELESGLAHNHC